jgi:hypothetical protein
MLSVPRGTKAPSLAFVSLTHPYPPPLAIRLTVRTRSLGAGSACILFSFLCAIRVSATVGLWLSVLPVYLLSSSF